MKKGFKDIIDKDGTFTDANILTTFDGESVAEECFKIIQEMSKGDMKKVSEACYETGLRDPYCEDNPDGVPWPMRSIS